MRIPSVSSLPPELRTVVEEEARHFDCSMSFVMVEAIAEAMGVKLGYTYKETEKPKKQTKGTSRIPAIRTAKPIVATVM